MDCWWAELEVKLSLVIQDQHKADVEELTGCNPLLLRPLIRPTRIIRRPQPIASVGCYVDVIEHLFSVLEKSDEVSNVRNNISASVAAQHATSTLEPVKWKL